MVSNSFPSRYLSIVRRVKTVLFFFLFFSFFFFFLSVEARGEEGRRVVLLLLCIDAYESQSAYLFKCEINKAVPKVLSVV